MKTKAYIIFFLFWGMIIGTTSGKNYQEKDGGVQVFLPKMTVELRFYTPNILRVTKYPKAVQTSVPAVGFSVIKHPDSFAF